MRPYLCACSTLGEVYDGTLFTRDAGMLVVEQYTSQLSDSKVRKKKKKHSGHTDLNLGPKRGWTEQANLEIEVFLIQGL